MSLINEMRRVVAAVVKDEQTASDVVYALIINFGGERLYVPSYDFEARNAEMRELYRHGASYEALAKRYHLSVKTVRRICGS